MSRERSFFIHGLKSKIKSKQTVIQVSLRNKDLIKKDNNFVNSNNGLQSGFVDKCSRNEILRREGTHNTFLRETNLPEVI